MENANITIIVIVGLAALVLVVFLIIRNQKDKKELNPSGPDAVEEEKTDIQNDRERA